MFEEFDAHCAEILNISIQEYINKIESISEMRMDILITNLLKPNLSEQKINQLKRIFNQL